ncbi:MULTISPECIES: winged helix-turn-helix domain-containing protein [unclassified Streptomyces]|uniref:winged helix-turn-helix domain-containing protein n=1 Tax=unclassified Streptomyces TaxID=2593676 RepID=UPI000CD51923|nr:MULTISPECIES: winged helix-turn-helix domain-containing protein [unclassified Streptomyces]AWL39686.1 winged helix-turn-helix domain-containing protein [Streptomyces sp. SM18]
MPNWPKGISPLTIPAVILSGASLAWTTWSLVDLLGTGRIGLTVAVGADIVWASVIAAEARGLRIPAPAGKGRNLVPYVGWAALLAVAGLLVWHGHRADSLPMAVAGPLLPLGAKVVWLLALTDMRDPTALTDDEQAVLARMERGLAFEEARHRVEMRRREMDAELQLAEVSTDFEIELTRMNKGRELARRRPLELTAYSPAEPTAHRAEPTPEPAEPPAEPQHYLHSSTQVATPEPPARAAEPQAPSFGFSAQLTAQQAQRAQAVEKVAELLAQDPGLTSAKVAERLNVSAATAKRYLREARQT